MTDLTDPKNMDKPVVRCSECDREVDHYNTFVSPKTFFDCSFSAEVPKKKL